MDIIPKSHRFSGKTIKPENYIPLHDRCDAAMGQNPPVRKTVP